MEPWIKMVVCVSLIFPPLAHSYDPPNLDQPIVNRDALLLDPNIRERLVEALTSVASNFPDSPLIDDDLKERSLALALTLDPLSVNARNTHRQLILGEKPERTSYFNASVSQVSEELWSVAERLARDSPEPEIIKLALCLRELSLLLHPSPPRSRVDSYEHLSDGNPQPWETMVKLQPEANLSSRKLKLLVTNQFTGPAPSVAPSSQTPQPLVNHLIYLCDFEQSDGSVDQGPRRNHGKANGTSFGPGRSRESKRAIRFTDKTHNLVLPIDISPHLIPEMTVCLWVRPEEAFRRYAEVFSHFDRQGLDRAIVIEKRPDKPYMWGVFRGADGVGLQPKAPAKVNEWTFVAATFSHTTLKTKLYVEDQVYEYVAGHGKGRPEIYIGNGNPNKRFIGSVDDLCLFNRVLEQDEINQIKNSKSLAQLISKSQSLPSDQLAPHSLPDPPEPKARSLNDGLIYACNFEESDGTLEQSPAENHGAAVGVKPVAGVARGQKAIYLNGLQNRVAGSANLRPADRPNVTISAWLKPEPSDQPPSVAFSTGVAGHRGFQFKPPSRDEPDKKVWAFHGGSGGFIFTEPVIYHQWVHLAAVYEHKTLRGRFYVNGKEYKSDNVATGWGSSIFVLGRSMGFGNHYRGAIDNVLIYERALSAGEVQSLYRNTGSSSRFQPPNKVIDGGGKLALLPSYVSCLYQGDGHPGSALCRFYVLESRRWKGELNLLFDLSLLGTKIASIKTCHLEVTVGGQDRAPTTDPITLSSGTRKLVDIDGAEANQILRFPVPLADLTPGKPLRLTLSCGTDEVILQKSEPHAVKLVFERK